MTESNEHKMSDVKTTIIDSESPLEGQALVPVLDQPPTVLPAIVQDELVPFQRLTTLTIEVPA